MVAMNTIAQARVETARPGAEGEQALERALAWFAVVEQACSRFDPESELMRLVHRAGGPVPVSAVLLEAVAFALEVARATKGAFDPAIGAVQQARGLRWHYLTGAASNAPAVPGSYRDVRVDKRAGTITLRRPVLLDLGAVAKGLALDLAARELAGYERFAVEAGGDLIVGAVEGAPAWRIGVRDPFGDGLAGTLTVRAGAVCTSGGYERLLAEGEHHLLDPRTGRSPRAVASVTVVAPSAMVADALSTAAFVLGPVEGPRLLECQGVTGIVIAADGTVRLTRGAEVCLHWQATGA
jgi:thiamine biosynthesis lipoprotein